MTVKGKIFKSYVEMIIWNHKFGSNKMVEYSATTLLSVLEKIEMNDVAAERLVDELCDAGYIHRHFTTTVTHRKFGHDQRYEHNWVGLTEKGWSVALKYVMSKHDAEEKFADWRNDMLASNDDAGWDLYTDRYLVNKYVQKHLPGWFWLEI